MLSISRGRPLATKRFYFYPTHIPRLQTRRILQPDCGHIQPRFYTQQSSGVNPPTSSFFRRAPSALTLLLIAGIGATAYGIYDIYSDMTLWPREVRSDLRAGLRAKHKGDLELCEQYLQRAWNNSKTLPIDYFKSEPHLKTSGIAIALASVLEDTGKLQQAYDIYLDALTTLQQIETKNHLTGPENLRAIAISYKLGEMAEQLDKPEDEERHLVWAVETILKSVLRLTEHPAHAPVAAQTIDSVHNNNETPVDRDTQTMVSQLSLPDWATRTDVASPLEALGALYTRAGRMDYAMPLYLQAISILIPPHPQYSSDEDRCRGAQLMSNLSELIIRSQSEVTEETLHQAEAWANKGLDIVMRAKETSSDREPACELAFAVALFNVAALRRMAGDKEEAKKLFLLSLKQSKAIQLQSGIEHAEDALRRME